MNIFTRSDSFAHPLANREGAVGCTRGACGPRKGDGEVIRKDGLFVPKDLKGLNPEKLK